ncbi:MAG: hypothetical protein Q4G51_04130 [Dermatophilus congolensis]|nr:hypothetical protein [Dermatophilus congolensis]
MAKRQWRRAISGACAIGATVMLSGVAACSGITVTPMDRTDTQGTAEPDVTHEPTGASEPAGTDAPPPSTDAAPGTSESEPLAPPNPVHPSWKQEEGTWRVYGVAWNDMLNVRSGAGADYPPVARLAPDSTGLTVYTPVARVGDAIWQPVGVEGGTGWVNSRFLRPDAAATPEIVGTQDAGLAAATKIVVDALEKRDYGRLSTHVHPTRGLMISPDAFVGGDEVVLTATEVAGAASDTQKHLWGYTDGEGLPIESTIADRLAAIAGSRALTSVRRIGFDRAVQNGNSIDNVADKFPGTRIVEYNYPGSESNSGFDWASVRFVFDTTGGGDPRLLAIVQDNWTI